MTETPTLRPKILLLIAVTQGIALLLLYRAHDAHNWPSQSPVWSYPMWTLAIAVPVLLLLSLTAGNGMRIARLVGSFSAALALGAAYIGRSTLACAQLRFFRP